MVCDDDYDDKADKVLILDNYRTSLQKWANYLFKDDMGFSWEILIYVSRKH